LCAYRLLCVCIQIALHYAKLFTNYEPSKFMTLAIVLDKKKMTTRGENAGRFHVKIRLTYTREKKTYQKYFLTNVYATPAEFTKFGGKGKKSDEISTKETAVHTLYEKGKDILKQRII
jgi:hypothetical protein